MDRMAEFSIMLGFHNLSHLINTKSAIHQQNTGIFEFLHHNIGIIAFSRAIYYIKNSAGSCLKSMGAGGIRQVLSPSKLFQYHWLK